MNIRWLWLNYVPDGISLTKEQRRFVTKRAEEVVLRKIILLVCGMVVGMSTVFWLDSRHFAFHGGTRLLLLFLVNVVCVYAIGWFFARPAVFRAIREARVNVCPKCGYDLRGQSEDRCSECGWEAGDEVAT